jgi:hypothetical protein
MRRVFLFIFFPALVLLSSSLHRTLVRSVILLSICFKGPRRPSHHHYGVKSILPQLYRSCKVYAIAKITRLWYINFGGNEINWKRKWRLGLPLMFFVSYLLMIKI